MTSLDLVDQALGLLSRVGLVLASVEGVPCQGELPYLVDVEGGQRKPGESLVTQRLKRPVIQWAAGNQEREVRLTAPMAECLDGLLAHSFRKDLLEAVDQDQPPSPGYRLLREHFGRRRVVKPSAQFLANGSRDH